eukprot:2569799-Amphidinium_carterae.1
MNYKGKGKRRNRDSIFVNNVPDAQRCMRTLSTSTLTQQVREKPAMLTERVIGLLSSSSWLTEGCSLRTC